MTSPLRFTVLVDARRPATDGAGHPLLARERGADRLAAALAALGHAAAVRESAVPDPLPSGWILFLGADPEAWLRDQGPRRDDVVARLVLLDEDVVSARELSEALPVPLVVTSRSYRNWLSGGRSAAQVIGRPALALRLGILLSPADAALPCALFTVPDAPLPEGLARCCAEVERSRVEGA